MAIRNFYLYGDVDGRETPVSGGPARKDGGMTFSLTQRDCGEIVTVIEVECRAHGDSLETIVRDEAGNIVYSKSTTR